MNTVHDILNFLATNWEFLPLSAALSLVMAGSFLPFKKWFGRRSEKTRDLVKLTFVFIAACIATAVHYVLTSGNPELIPVKSAILTFMAQPWWIALYKPLGKWLGTQYAKVAAWDAQMKSATEGQPADFSN